MTKAISSWSGGKDSGFACYLAQRQGYDVTHLVNFISQGVPEGVFPWHQGASGGPAGSGGPPPSDAVCGAGGHGSLRADIQEGGGALKRRGAEAMVFGDIYLDEHREWVERVCGELGLKPVLPLWGKQPEALLKEFIDAGFEAVVVSAKADIFSEEWVGRTIDHGFLGDLNELVKGRDIDVCGEKGEYHTVLVDGPLFKQRLEIVRGDRVQRDGYWFLDVPRCRAVSKSSVGGGGRE